MTALSTRGHHPYGLQSAVVSDKHSWEPTESLCDRFDRLLYVYFETEELTDSLRIRRISTESSGIQEKSNHLDAARRAGPQLVEQLRAIVDFELGVQAAHVGDHGLDADVQPCCDGGLREPFGQCQTDFLFPRGQAPALQIAMEL